MAQKVIRTLTDDLDGTESKNIETITFGLHGTGYEIDLTKALAPYVKAARKTRKTPTKPKAAGGEAKVIRAWAKANGHDVPERGRIPIHVVRAYRAAGS
jgi:hypothetical protein